MPARAVPDGSSTRGKGQVKYHKRNAKSLRDLYEEACIESSVTPNSSVLNLLPERLGVEWEGNTLDLSRNYVGDRGLTPVLGIVQRCPNLNTLILTDNGLRNNAIKNMVNAMLTHPGLTHIDVSDNFISEGAGVALARLAEQNSRIVKLEFVNTKIDTDLRLKIKTFVKANQEKAAATAVP